MAGAGALMQLLSPLFLVLLVALPLLAVARVLVMRRRQTGFRYSSLSLVRDLVPRRSSWIRRHVPFALFLAGLAGLVVAMARPVGIVSIPAGQTTIILAMDVSGSMCATDIPPSRLVAAERAAASFIERQGSTTRIGVVAFAGFAEMVQVPTNDTEVLLDVVESLTTGRRTAVGSAILRSIDAIAEIDPNVVASTPEDADPNAAPPSVPKGAYAPAIIVLLTDGASNTGPLPLEAANQAAVRGLRVYTIGFGTANPGDRSPLCSPQFIGREPLQSGDPFNPGGFGGGGFGGGGGGGFGGGFRRAIDEPTLMGIAEATGGEYYPAQSAEELNKVFDQLPTSLITKHEVVDISFAFLAAAALLVVAGLLLSQRWRPLP